MERVFNASIADGEKFLSYERYWGIYREESPPPDGRPFYGYGACEARLAGLITDISKDAYIAVRGMGLRSRRSADGSHDWRFICA